MLHEGDLLKLGKVLLLAQETANRSIKRALLRRRDGNDEAEIATERKHGVVDHTVVACGSDEKPVSASLGPEEVNCDNGDDIVYKRRDKSISPTFGTHAGPCLWCSPPPAGCQQRHHAPFLRRERPTTGRAYLPKPGKQSRTRLKENPYALPSYCRNPSNPRKPTRARTGGRTPDREEVPRSPPKRSGKESNRAEIAVADESRKEQPVSDSSEIEVVEENDRLLGRGGGDSGHTAPRAFFCSWECAGRWNARFSPVQARHERGLRIDIAAGRLVAR